MDDGLKKLMDEYPNGRVEWTESGYRILILVDEENEGDVITGESRLSLEDALDDLWRQLERA